MLSESQAPDLEELAAFVDGRLSGKRKTQVEERLLRDEDYYEVFLETVQFQAEHRQAEHRQAEHGQEEHRREEPGEVVRGPAVWWRGPAVWWRRPRVATAAASLAAAVVLVVVIGLLRPGQGPSAGDQAAYLDPAAVVAREGWADPGWSRLRSDNIARGRYQPEEIAFRLGVRAIDLRVALAAQDRQAAKRLATVLEQLADAADLFPAAAGYGDLRQQIDSAEFDVLVARTANVERSLTDSFEASSPETRRFALGAWSEAGRLAALTHDGSALARVLRLDPDAWSIDKIAREKKSLEEVLERPDPDAENFDEAVEAFKRIIYALAG